MAQVAGVCQTGQSQASGRTQPRGARRPCVYAVARHCQHSRPICRRRGGGQHEVRPSGLGSESGGLGRDDRRGVRLRPAGLGHRALAVQRYRAAARIDGDHDGIPCEVPPLQCS
ncbi:excalibur calcium-binding domain-containing protein [Cupriavidus basilensis]|uniref:excalibur calcium-binding domain-containing protein n=1 Tax=Cupriavidus basilensis TaxID=68895 RepID=UPI0035A28E5E